ncbi:MAG: DUF2207 domain-containing protein [Synergistaceae bacterium]|nr:DUF2207 domain-containing protein [Synergistaceae bacterium]
MEVSVTVSADSSIRVTEGIIFITEGHEIRRGLIRGIPVVHMENGRRVRGKFTVERALLDGSPVPYKVRDEGDLKEIYLGDDSLLLLGAHRYEITYTLTRQLIFHDDGDELYWNVTGNDWIFPIFRASFSVSLPDGAEIFESDAAVGVSGARGKEWTRDSGGLGGVFRTTRELAPGEGFSVSVVWPKGFVSPPPKSRFELLIERHGSKMVVLAAFTIFAWYAGCWFFFGKDPKRGVVYPVFSPPHGFEPAYVGYIKKLKFDSDLLTADILDLAVKGFLSISESEGSAISGGAIKLTRTDKLADGSLSYPLRELLEKLFPHSGERTKNLGDGAFMQKLLSDLPSRYKALSRPVLSHNNKVFSLCGLALFVPFTVLILIVSPDMPGEIFFIAILIFILSGFLRVILPFVKAVRGFLKVGGNTLKTVPGVVLIIIILFTFTIFLQMFASFFTSSFLVGGRMFVVFWRRDPVVASSVISALFSVVIFSKLMPSRTRIGRLYLDEVEGFEMYLKTAERHRLEALYPAIGLNVPKLTPEVFESILPYAFALGVAETWVNTFSSRLMSADYRPNWYDSSSRFNISNFGSSISSMGMAVRRHSSPAGSSGRGGGTSSGGGRGGGGGRGR